MSAAVANNAPTTGGITGAGWLPGRSGNPSGRPKGIARQLRDAIKDDPTRITSVFLAIADDPDAKPADRIAAGREYLDRAYGKAPSFAPVDGENPLELDSVARRIASLVDELAEKRAASLARGTAQSQLAATG